MSDSLDEIRRFAEPIRPSQGVVLTYVLLAAAILFGPVPEVEAGLCGLRVSILGIAALAFIGWRLLKTAIAQGVAVTITPHRLSLGERSFLWEEVHTLRFSPDIEITLQSGEKIELPGCTLPLRDADALQAAADQALARVRSSPPADDLARRAVERLAERA